MRLYKYLLIAALSALLLVPLPLLACKPLVTDARDFVKHASWNDVGFTGEVIAMDRGAEQDSGTPLVVTIKTARWFLGVHHRIMKVRGFISNHSSTPPPPCPSPTFNPKVGDEVVVFGKIEDGFVTWIPYIVRPLPRVIFFYGHDGVKPKK